MTEQATANAEPPFETRYDDEPKAGDPRWKRPVKLARKVAGEVRDGVLSAIPVEVTEHLVNSRKELMMAGIALGEAGVRRADAVLKRARELREPRAGQPTG